MSLDARIDDLYSLPLGEFTASRNALAKTLSGDEAKRVRALAKPTLVPWAINRLYWKARPVYDRLIRSGAALRGAQIAALTGREGDVRPLAEDHRRALADAVRRARELASTVGSHPDGDDLARMLETLSLSASPTVPGRLTGMLQPAGFEALAGVQPAVTATKIQRSGSPNVLETERADARLETDRAETRRVEAQRLEADRLEAEYRRLEASLRSAEQALAETKTAEALARDTLSRAADDRRAAEARLASARQALDDHSSRVRRSFRAATGAPGR